MFHDSDWHVPTRPSRLKGIDVDIDTMKAYIEDLLQERKDLYERLRALEAEVKRLENELARHA
jgi:hypothetical protein